MFWPMREVRLPGDATPMPPGGARSNCHTLFPNSGKVWCRGRGSNSHALTGTAPSTLLVYQFRHLGRCLFVIPSAIPAEPQVPIVARCGNYWQERRDSNPRPPVLETVPCHADGWCSIRMRPQNASEIAPTVIICPMRVCRFVCNPVCNSQLELDRIPTSGNR